MAQAIHILWFRQVWVTLVGTQVPLSVHSKRFYLPEHNTTAQAKRLEQEQARVREANMLSRDICGCKNLLDKWGVDYSDFVHCSDLGSWQLRVREAYPHS